MITRFVCLANSYKEGGRCIAGIEVDLNNNPIILDGKPKWTRPVCNTQHGEISTDIAAAFHILSIIEIEVINAKPDGYQSENVTFIESSIKTIGSMNRNGLKNFLSNHNLIFSNRGKAVSEETIETLNYSLMLISVTEFEVHLVKYSEEQEHPQKRLKFNYNSVSYDLPITDPVFKNKHDTNPNVLSGTAQIYLSLSLAVENNGWHSKLVAGIL